MTQSLEIDFEERHLHIYVTKPIAFFFLDKHTKIRRRIELQSQSLIVNGSNYVSKRMEYHENRHVLFCYENECMCCGGCSIIIMMKINRILKFVLSFYHFLQMISLYQFVMLLVH